MKKLLLSSLLSQFKTGLGSAYTNNDIFTFITMRFFKKNKKVHPQEFEPMQTKRKLPETLQNMKGDGDIWFQRVVYCSEGHKRIFFQSMKTDRCVWDEPPSGAANLLLVDDIEKIPLFRNKYGSGATTPPCEALS